MATKSFDKMTRTELEEASKFLKVEVLPSEDGKELVNADFVKALTAFKESQAEATPKEVTPKKGITKEVKAINKAAGLKLGIEIVVTDHDNTVDIEEDEQGRVFRFSWGNTKNGNTTASVVLHGKPQYISRGALKSLRTKTYMAHLKDVDGRPFVEERVRFSISETAGWTKEQFAAHKETQKLKRI